MIRMKNTEILTNFDIFNQMSIYQWLMKPKNELDL